MGMIVGLLAILGYALHLNRLTNWKIESSLLHVCSTLICVLYFSGLYGLLFPAALLILGMGALLFVSTMIVQLRNGSFAQNITPGVIFFVYSVVALWGLTSSEYYSNFVFVDDFSHWGRVPKIITDNDRLLISTDAVWYQDYPPGLALFDYIFLRASGFSANLSMFSQGIFILAALAHIFSSVPKTISKYAFIGITIFIYTLIYFHGPGFHTLSVDLIVGVVFGVAVLGYLADRQTSKLASIIRLAPLVMVLPLIKPTGVLFSAVIIGVVLLDIFLVSTRGKERARLVTATAAITILCALTYASWGKHVQNLELKNTLNVKVSISDIANAFNPSAATERQKATIENFVKRVFLPHPESKINRPYYWLALCLGFIWLIRRMGGDYKAKERYAPFGVLFCGFCAYLAVLLVLYMFFFGGYEGPRLASFDRYVNTYLVGVIIVLFGVMLSQYFKEKRDKATTISVIIISIFVMLPNLKATQLDLSNAIKGRQDVDVESVSKYWKLIETKTLTNSRIYFIWQGGNGTENSIFNYGIMPKTNNQGCWSVGEPYDDNDVWTCRMTVKEFEQTLKNYDYLFVAKSDSKFEENFSSLFGSVDVSNGSLFQVAKEGSLIKLQKI